VGGQEQQQPGRAAVAACGASRAAALTDGPAVAFRLPQPGMQDNDEIINDEIINDEIINDEIINDEIINDAIIIDAIMSPSAWATHRRCIGDAIINDG
jgi:hypothetical protein